MAEEQQDLSPEEQQQIQLVCDGIKKYIENMAIPDTAKQDYLTGVFYKYKDNPIIYNYILQARNWLENNPSSKFNINRVNHFVKNLKPTMKASTYEVPKYESQFSKRDKVFSGDSYTTHKWKLGKDVNEPGFATGMDDLSRIILDAKSDVKYNKKLSTEMGAQYWVQQKNKTQPPGKEWKVYVTDLNEDNVPEIVITDANGNIRYVNGWHLGKSKGLLNTAHQNYIDTQFGTPAQIAAKRRQGTIGKGDLSLKRWIYDNTKVNEDNPYGPLLVSNVLTNAGYKSRALNTCNIFMKYVTKDLYDEVMTKYATKYAQDPLRFKALKSAASIISINAKCYAKYVSNPVYKELSEERHMSDKQMRKKYPGSNVSPFSDECSKRIGYIISDENQKKGIKEVIEKFIDQTEAVLATEGQYGHKDYVEPADWKDRRVNQKSFDYNKWRGINFQ